MISAWDIYLIGNIDSFGILMVVFAIFCAINIVFCMDKYPSSKGLNNKEHEELVKKFEEENPSVPKELRFSFWIGLAFLLVYFFIPNQKTLASMYVLPPVLKAVQDNKQVQQIPQAVLDLIKSYENKEEK